MNSRRDNDDSEVAAQWLARRDRGLTPAEQDAYLQWLTGSKSRAASVADFERVWARLDAVRHWRPGHSAHPNPDILAPRRARARRAPWVLGAVAALAAVLAVAFLNRHSELAEPARLAQIVPGPERLVLEDGSLVELNTGARVEVLYDREVRRVRFVQGEAHFTVAKNPARPFVVEVDGYAVRAVGTAFMVGKGGGDVEVTVTEGHVRLGLAPALQELHESVGDTVLTDLHAGQQAITARRGSLGTEAGLTVRHLSPLELDAAMAWRGIRLEFDDLPLGDIVREFNRYNVRQLVIADPETAQIRVGGNFRADNLGAFVRLLDTGFDVAAEARGDEIVLRRR